MQPNLRSTDMQILGGNHDKGIWWLGRCVIPCLNSCFQVSRVRYGGKTAWGIGSHHFFANTTTSRGEYVSRNHCPSNWRDIYKAETIFPLLQAWDRYGPLSIGGTTFRIILCLQKISFENFRCTTCHFNLTVK